MKHFLNYTLASKVAVTFFALIALCMTVNAGGASTRFTGYADEVLKQSDELYKLISQSFTIEDPGFLGPLEQRMIDGVIARKYTYHQFRASHKISGEHFIVRIHFKDKIFNESGEHSFYNRVLDRVEIIPAKMQKPGESGPRE